MATSHHSPETTLATDAARLPPRSAAGPEDRAPHRRWRRHDLRLPHRPHQPNGPRREIMGSQPVGRRRDWGYHTIAGALASGATIVCGIVVGAVGGLAYYSAKNAFSNRWSTKGAIRATVVGGLGGAAWGGAAKAIGWRLSSKTPLGVRFSNKGGRGTDFLWKGKRAFGIHSHRVIGKPRHWQLRYHRRYNGPGGGIGRHRPWQGW